MTMQPYEFVLNVFAYGIMGVAIVMVGVVLFSMAQAVVYTIFGWPT